MDKETSNISPLPIKADEGGDFVVFAKDDIGNTFLSFETADAVAKASAQETGHTMLIYMLVGGYRAESQTKIRKMETRK